MHILEDGSHLSTIAMGIAIVYTAFSLHSWKRQSVIFRRADVAKDVLVELEIFYLKLEELVSWQYLLQWTEWGQAFNIIFRSNFLIAKLRVKKLKNKTIDLLLKEMQEIAIKFPGDQRLSTQIDPQGQLFWKKESSQANKDFRVHWERYKEAWVKLEELLSKEALYDM